MLFRVHSSYDQYSSCTQDFNARRGISRLVTIKERNQLLDKSKL